MLTLICEKLIRAFALTADFLILERVRRSVSTKRMAHERRRRVGFSPLSSPWGCCLFFRGEQTRHRPVAMAMKNMAPTRIGTGVRSCFSLLPPSQGEQMLLESKKKPFMASHFAQSGPT